jgi:HAD superfamily hydrolase (TIGR01509 family)
MTTQPLRAVLFDFDGTLTPSLPLWLNAYQLTLRHFNIEISDDEVLRRCFFRDWAVIAAEFNVFTAEQLQAQLAIGLQQAFTDAVLFPAAEEVIKHCREQGLRVALVTSSPRALVVEVIGRLLIHDLFDYVVCGDDVQNYKPHPEPVLAALAAFDLAPGEAIMIGDSHVDILAGKAAGTRTALFLHEDHGRFHNTEKLRATAPDHIFSSHEELPSLLGLQGWGSR